MRVSHVGVEGRGNYSGMARVRFAWIRACVKASDPDYPDKQKWKPKKIKIAC